MFQLNLKPTHKAVEAYYHALRQLSLVQASEEGAVRSAFQSLLNTCAGQLHWTLRPEYPIRRRNQPPLRVDAALFDDSRLVRGLWEAKDEHDDLEKEVRRKLSLGYPDNNILFQAPTQAILVQGGFIRHKEDISQPDALVHVVRNLFEYRTPEIERWEDAVARFREEVPEQARALKELIDREHAKNSAFREAFAAFVQTCRTSLNPNLADEAVERMLIQHILTERIFTKLFDNDEFRSRNVVAAEIEKVVSALIKGSFNRTAFLASLEPFYKAIELSAKTTSSYEEKQGFLNNVYERFFQSFSPKEADTHGIVYTPQPIVDFMVRSVEDILKKEFGKSLADRGVHILDPFVGTGNFITRIMREIAATRKSALRDKYQHELHCNEVMLLPYYIASMNIEHEYLAQTGQYDPFPGICLVDTFELAEPKQHSLGFMNEENTARVQRQKKAPIFVIIGNPPYNVGQVDENDNNKNRKYPEIDRRVSETYGCDSSATSVSKLNDVYVKAFRWAADRVGEDGIVAFVTNSGFLTKFAFDGVRKHLRHDFNSIYVLDLGGDVRRNPKLSGTKHNVFGIQVGVSINFFVRRRNSQRHDLYYAAVHPDWTATQKYQFLDSSKCRAEVSWQILAPDSKETWLTTGLRGEFDEFVALGAKIGDGIFGDYGLGVSTNRDAWCYNFQSDQVVSCVRSAIQFYNTEVRRWEESDRKTPIDEFVSYDDRRISWSRDLKADLKRCRRASFSDGKIRRSLYRPFTFQYLFLDRVFNEEVYGFPRFFPAVDTENTIIVCTDVAARAAFTVLATNAIPNLHVGAAADAFQCFPFYTYDEDGSNRRENITDWALTEFRAHYRDDKITKWDIFHYVYAVLHHPDYRERYAANLKRELPRIPYAPDFWGFAKAGARLAELHVDYEKQPEYGLQHIENPNEFPNYRVEKMRLGRDKLSLRYNGFLTLSGIPPEVFEYRLGNRSALDWVIDQYQVSIDKRSGITNDPNRADDEQYIVRLIGQVITVSLETVKIVKALPPLSAETSAAATTTQ